MENNACFATECTCHGLKVALDAKELISLSIASTTAAAANTTAAATVATAVQKRLSLRFPGTQVSDSRSRLRAHVCHESVTERDSDKKTNGRGARPQKNCVYELFNFSS